MAKQKLLTVREVAERIGVSLRTAYRLPLPFVRATPRTMRVSEDELLRFLESKTVQP